MYTNTDVDRFSSKVRMSSEQECWIWTGARHSKNRGYGKFRLNGRVMNAHKASYLLFVGEVEPGQVIGHQCNRESCVNPAHLKAESQSENMRYCVRCGRHNSQS